MSQAADTTSDDPKFNEKNRRKLREKYYDLIKKTNESGAQLSRPGAQDLQKNIEDGNKIFETVAHAREASLDALWLKQTSSYGLEQVNKISVGSEFKTEEFADALKQKFGARSTSTTDEENALTIDWNALGKYTCNMCLLRHVPPLTFMAGPLQIEAKEKERKKSQRKKVNEGVDSVQPEQVSSSEKSENETTKLVTQVFKRIKKKDNKPSSYLDVVIEPDSFTKTIENMFYFAFLVKEGRVALQTEKNAQTVDKKRILTGILDAPKPATDDNKQAVLKLDLARYKQLCERLKNEKELPVPDTLPEVQSGKISSQKAAATQRARKRKREESDEEDEENEERVAATN